MYVQYMYICVTIMDHGVIVVSTLCLSVCVSVCTTLVAVSLS